jgi:hypothetical protein
MNEPHESLSDDMLDNALKPFRDVPIPDQTRVTNRAAVERALASRVQRPWWRKTVAVPLPVAIAATVALAVTGAVAFSQFRAQPRVEQVVSQPIMQQFIEQEPAADFGEKTTSRLGWSVTQSYIQSLISLGGRDVFEPELKEKRNEL